MKSIFTELEADINDLNNLNVAFHKSFIYSKSSWTHWGDFLEMINYNILTLESASKLVNQNCYRDSLILIRAVFESYFLIKISMLGKYDYQTISKKQDESYSDFENRIKQEATNAGLKVTQFEKIAQNKLKIIYRLPQIVGGDKIISSTYFVMQDFDPNEAHLKLKNNPKGFGARHKNLYNAHLNMPKAIIDRLKLNRLISSIREEDAIRVHYNFLSKFTHSNKESFDILNENYQKAYLDSLDELQKENHDIKLLAYLYVLFLSIYFLELQIKFFTHEKEIRVTRLKSLRDKIKKLKSKYYFFWFIYNKPSEYDYYDLKIHNLWDKKYKSKGNKIIRYYKDPLGRLKNLSLERSNFTIGKYRPPKILGGS